VERLPPHPARRRPASRPCADLPILGADVGKDLVALGEWEKGAQQGRRQTGEWRSVGLVKQMHPYQSDEVISTL